MANYPRNIHLFGVKTPPDVFVPLFLLGSDTLGHDLPRASSSAGASR
jgi:hypothetical protein